MKSLDELFQGVKTVAIAGHVRPDGDCVGSCLATYNYITTYYPQIEVSLYLQPIPNIFKFMKNSDKIISDCTADISYDLFIAQDCGDLGRLGDAAKYFEHAKKTACIDHHISNPGFAQVNHIRGDVSSACEVLYGLLDPEKVNCTIAKPVYTGMVHDTGVFQYSSTSPETMRIAGELMKTGFDFSKIIDESFYQKTYVQNQVMGRVLAESIMLLDGKCIIGYLKKKDLEFYGVDGKDLDGIVSQLRLTQGVEVAMFIYELETQSFKVSLRSNGKVDVSKIAVYFGGGGHKRAAGCDLQGSMYDVINNISEQICKQFQELEI